ncbi:hypothetical protein BJX64DRAFT_59278 [Aspergillus heterothallicus]
MDRYSQFTDPPPPYEDIARGVSISPRLPPAVLLLDGQIIRDEATSAPLYQLSRAVTTLPRTPPKNSSITVERVQNIVPGKAESSETPQAQSQHRHLFYLAHPADAQYRTHIPAYYITCVETETVGNIHLETTKSRLQRKGEFTAWLSPRRTAWHRPLFDEAGKRSTLFSARPGKWTSSRYVWTGGDGARLAVEEMNGEQHGLDISTPMTQEMRDALIAVWLLRLWYETAESKQAKKEELERMMPPMSYQDWTMGKRVGGLGALAGAGGG